MPTVEEALGLGEEMMKPADDSGVPEPSRDDNDAPDDIDDFPTFTP
jgi:hypothetical protein